VHRDIKPENILFGSDWSIKLADFGFATLSVGREGSGMCETNLGTPGYKAPEIYMGTPYSGTDADLFATGVILFIMLNHNPPFTEADPRNPYYKRLYSNPQAFWKAAAAQKPEGYFSPDF
jgi:serine/threonine protein kinase